MRGAREAKGEVLYFVDGHTECNTGWLEPLLSRIAENRNTLVVPNVDPIQWDTLAYLKVAGDYLGAFDWNLIYFYKPIPQHITDARIRKTDPIPNPIMVGCAHAIDRNYFFETGAYDASMEIWGGENIEHSFRLWMCGGKVEMIPCSKVGHIFKPLLPYSFGIHGSGTIKRNLVQVAEVWMDNYKDYFYATQDKLPPIDVKSMLKRKKLRHDLKCKSFDWYMKTIISDMPIPPTEALYFGKITPENEGGRCFIIKNNELRVAQCEFESWKSVTFAIDRHGRFKFEDQCIGVERNSNENPENLYIDQNCNNSISLWRYDTVFKQIRVSPKDLCLEEDVNSHTIKTKKCDKENTKQKWNFEITFDFTRKHNVLKTSMEHQMIPRKAIRFGAMINIEQNYCLNIGNINEYEMIPCEDQLSVYQIIHLNKDKRLICGDKCVIVTDQNKLGIETCNKQSHSQQIWEYNGHTMHFYTNKNSHRLCWTFLPEKSSIDLILCNVSNVHQRWKFLSSSRQT